VSLFDLPREQRPRWFRQWCAAVQLNAENLDLWGLVFEESGLVKGPGEAAEAAALLVRQLPYRWRPEPGLFGISVFQRTLDLASARRRGYAACADASAAAAAAALIAGGEPELCYERVESLESYAHVRMYVEGRFIDAYPEASFEVARCALRETVTKERVGWPAAADEMLSRLDEERRKATPR
jgi:hypothetical protein